MLLLLRVHTATGRIDHQAPAECIKFGLLSVWNSYTYWWSQQQAFLPFRAYPAHCLRRHAVVRTLTISDLKILF